MIADFPAAHGPRLDELSEAARSALKAKRSCFRRDGTTHLAACDPNQPAELTLSVTELVHATLCTCAPMTDFRRTPLVRTLEVVALVAALEGQVMPLRSIAALGRRLARDPDPLLEPWIQHTRRSLDRAGSTTHAWSRGPGRDALDLLALACTDDRPPRRLLARTLRHDPQEGLPRTRSELVADLPGMPTDEAALARKVLARDVPPVARERLLVLGHVSDALDPDLSIPPMLLEVLGSYRLRRESLVLPAHLRPVLSGDVVVVLVDDDDRVLDTATALAEDGMDADQALTMARML